MSVESSERVQRVAFMVFVRVSERFLFVNATTYLYCKISLFFLEREREFVTSLYAFLIKENVKLYVNCGTSILKFILIYNSNNTNLLVILIYT